jgi:DNA-directed RNA polymerase subunit RPC12/RpoP
VQARKRPHCGEMNYSASKEEKFWECHNCGEKVHYKEEVDHVKEGD